jgi:hypothetical protein
VSLISEGLKKAQLDAMRQDRAQRHVYLTSARVQPSGRNGSHVAVLLAIGMASAVLTAAALLWLRRPDPVPVVPQVRVEPVRPVVTKAAPEAAPIVAPIVAQPVAVQAPPRVTRKAPVEDVAKVEKQEQPRGRRDGFVEGQTYASPVSSPGGREPLSVAGIIGSGDRLLAIINGSTVRPGSMVGPFVVESIDRRRVKLRYIDVHFYVTP